MQENIIWKQAIIYCGPEGFCTASLAPGIHQVFSAHLPTVSEVLAFSSASVRTICASVEEEGMALPTHRAIVCLTDPLASMHCLPIGRCVVLECWYPSNAVLQVTGVLLDIIFVRKRLSNDCKSWHNLCTHCEKELRNLPKKRQHDSLRYLNNYLVNCPQQYYFV